MTQIIYLVLHINYQKKNNNNKKKKMRNILVLIWSPLKGAGIKVIGLMNIKQIKKVFSKINL